MNFNDYVNERLEGMYSILEASNNRVTDSIELSHLKKQMDIANADFIDYLYDVYDGAFNRKEIDSINTIEELQEVAKKYEKDFNNWKMESRVAKNIKWSWISTRLIGALGIPMPIVGILTALIGSRVFKIVHRKIVKNNKQKEKWDELTKDE